MTYKKVLLLLTAFSFSLSLNFAFAQVITQDTTIKIQQQQLLQQQQLNRRMPQSAPRTVVGADSTKRLQDTVDNTNSQAGTTRSRIFGADLFTTAGLTFEPNLRLATPTNYQLGPDDQLLIDIYGYSEASYRLTITPEGTINVPNVGVIQVGGMSIEQATARIRFNLSKIYTGLRSGNTSLKVALGNIRSIKVILTGQLVKPGTYTLPSLATVFNALYASGGPTETGSFREIQVLRAGKRIAVLDLYDFLLNGEFKNNVRLQDQDVINIPVYRTRVEIIGEVKQPGIFEILNGESFQDLLRFSGDFNEQAYRARVKVMKNTATEREIADILVQDFSTYKPSSGDRFIVDRILERVRNRVTVQGAVFRPGPYELIPGLSLSQLITLADGLREDAFQNQGYITRLKEDLQTELLTFDVARVLSGQDTDILLKREDVITISSIFDLKSAYSLRVEGEVRNPGSFSFSEGMSLENAIIRAGGFNEGASSKRVEVSRREKNSDELSGSATIAQVFQFDVDPSLKDARKIILQPYDIVTVRPAPGYEVQRQVKITGEVLYPGIYTLKKKDERVSDLVARAGGFTALAYAPGASLKRTTTESEQVRNARMLQFRRMQANRDVDSTTLATLNQDVLINTSVGINLETIMAKPYSRVDIFLKAGDSIAVPQQSQTVKLSGEVLSPLTVVYSPRKGFKQYIASAGGYTDRARKKKAYVIYPNGSVQSATRFLFFNNYPKMQPGSEIFVPERELSQGMSVQQIIGITSGLATAAALIVTLFR